MNRFNYIVNEFPAEPMPANSTFSLSISSVTEWRRLDLKSIHQLKNNFINKITFSIFLEYHPDNAISLAEELLKKKNKLFQLFFHPLYEIKKMRPVVFFSSKWIEHKEMNHCLRVLESECKLQGFRNLQAVFLQQDHIIVKKPASAAYRIHNLQELSDSYYELLVKEQYYGNYITLWLNGHQFKDVSDMKRNAEEKFRTTFPIQYELANQFVELNTKVSLLEENLQNANEDLANQKQYVELIRQYDEANKINQFYYNEYEILPLWYKRLGHVIKILTGKRSFRSLYNTNAKKYKS